MNRLQPSDAKRGSSLASGSNSKVGSAVFKQTGSGSPSAFFAPLHYEANYAYPLIVWLHGPGDDESQLKRVMPMISLRNYVAVGIRGTSPATSPKGRSGYGWRQTPSHIAQAEQRVLETIDAAQQRFHIAPRRVFVAGYDCGGTMAFRLAMAHPARFAGVLSFCGEFPAGGTPLVRLTDARRVPLFVASGRDSQKYPPEQVCDNLRLFHVAGMDVALRQYPCGHELMPLMLADMDRWIMEQVTGVSRSTSVWADCN